ncbi:iron-containing alcohol dehydrogenase [Plebeiibacterium marinum]|uniref:Iron-containing alcohol dehydrogenase n=1 Tax=Plebeiibacterium marinum TaxID=2992111 RepID=A0AAE3SJK6_9BACT|nr:iron-containing alcohol dehydrogenase [Plebeiobacterium marinum]MCW3805493.1 iron-containing alcohol dehydrogenase [Plebeiobacterium marinum]
MENFNFYVPTTVHFGKGQIENLASSIKQFGGSKVMLAYGGGSIKKNGIYDTVTSELKKADIPFVDCDGIKPNPPVADVRKGIQIYRDNSCDFILAVGGGSTIDAAKAMAAGVCYDGDVMDLMADGKGEITAAAPLASVLTMAGTGSELDLGGVITGEVNHKKHTIMHPLLYPKFSILDPTFSFSVPEKHSMAGSFDALDHLLECYFIAGSESTDVQNMMNEGLMRSIIKNAPKVLANPEDYDARANIMWASSMALASFQFAVGKKGSNWPMHAMGHELSSLYDMTHGVTLALIAPSYLAYTLEKAPEYTWLFANFARNVFGVVQGDDALAAKEGIAKVKEFADTINMPKNLKEAGVEEGKLEYLAEKATEWGNIGALCPIEKEDALEIYKRAFL